MCKFLPHPSVSMTGLVALLCRWAHCSAQGGGFRNPNDKAAASELLEGLLRGCCDKEFVISICFDDSWEPSGPFEDWRRCEPCLRVMPDKTVDVSELNVMAAKPEAPATMQRWQHELARSKLAPMGSRVGVVELIGKTAGCASLRALHCVSAFGSRIENILTKSRLGEPCPKEELLTCRPVDISELLWDRRQLDVELLRQLVAGIAATEQAEVQAISWATDKANIGGIGLESAVWALPSNVGNIFPPQVVI